MTLRLLVFGATGQVARELRRLDGPLVRVRALGRDEADLGDPEACAAAIGGADADAVINAAAYTAVDRAETEEALARRVNAEAPGAMARAAAAAGLPFVHLSTDYVFDGAAGAPRAEDAPTGPLGAYGRSKLAGETAVAAAGGRFAILRTSWVFSAHGVNFVRTMLAAARTRDELRVVDDQRGGPTAAADIAAAAVAVAGALARGAGETGVFHYCGAPDVTWRGFAEEIFRQAPWSPQPRIVPIATADWPTPARRPADSRLDCGRIARIYGIPQPDWRQSLGAALAALAPGLQAGS